MKSMLFIFWAKIQVCPCDYITVLLEIFMILHLVRDQRFYRFGRDL